MKLSKTMRKRMGNNTWCCLQCSSIIHGAQVCLTCGSIELSDAILNDLYEADKKDAKFRSLLDLPFVSESERLRNKTEKRLYYIKEWKDR